MYKPSFIQISKDGAYKEGDIPLVLLYFIEQKLNCPSGSLIDIPQ